MSRGLERYFGNMEKDFKAAVRDIVVRIADTDKALSEKLHAEWLDYSKDSVARNGLVLPDEGMNYEGSEMNEGMLDEGTP